MLEDIFSMGPKANSNFKNMLPGQAAPSSQLVPETQQRHEILAVPSSDIVDLTSIRVSTSSTRNSLQILNRVEELPSTHVCRGIYLTERSPFVDVASTEKRKRASFFHAATNAEPQPIYLSRFKVPRRTRPNHNSKITDKKEEPTTDAGTSTTTSAGEDRENQDAKDDEGQDLLKLILMQMTTMQTQLNARFDVVDDKLQQLTSRLEQLERNGGTSPVLTQSVFNRQTNKQTDTYQDIMGRSRSRAAPARRAPAPAQPRRPAPAPARTQAAPPPAPHTSSGGGMMSGLMGTVAQGMAFGTGSAIAHRAVGAVAGSMSGGSDAPQQQEAAPAQQDYQAAQPPQQNQCGADQKSFLECLNNNSNDISSCQFYLDQFKQCQLQQQSSFM
ncbi:hypothetical protein BBJ29_008377 [Phytophthora kernoviae]|uniref:CHCH domain-containing protein n=1 Tax=Phytophthora kernoviae TaxID=325452 RepID=A0A3R7K6X1_9STRA|nr:hypothetical protein BBJ29_008377 [Phytophthora kernoviae]